MHFGFYKFEQTLYLMLPTLKRILLKNETKFPTIPGREKKGNSLVTHTLRKTVTKLRIFKNGLINHTIDKEELLFTRVTRGNRWLDVAAESI